MTVICGKCRKEFDPKKNDDCRCPYCYKDKPMRTVEEIVPSEVKEEWLGKRKTHLNT